MRIAIFTNTYAPHTGGVARSVALMREGLENVGHSCLVVAPEFNGQMLPEDGVIRVPAIRNFNGSGFSLRLPLPANIGEAIKRFQPDVVHSHHPFLLGDSALRMAYQWDRPLVFTHHTRYELYTHYVAKESAWLKRLVVELVTAYERCCDGVIVPTPSMAETLGRLGLRESVRIIPTGIDLTAFRSGSRKRGRSRWGIPEDAEVIGHLGRLTPEKNLHVLIPAVKRSLEANAGRHFLLVGEGSEREWIRYGMGQSGLLDRFHMVGEVLPSEVPDLYAAMDVFVFSSLSETQGIVLLEALASAVPVVALKATGAVDLIRDGVNGRLLAPKCGPGRFAQAVDEVLSRVRKEPAWQEVVRASVAAFSMENSIAKLEAVYARLVDACPRRDATVWERFLNRMEGERQLALAHSRALMQALNTRQYSADGGCD